MALRTASGDFPLTEPQNNPTSGLSMNGTWAEQDGAPKQGGQVYVFCSAPFEIAPGRLVSPARFVTFDNSGLGVVDVNGIADYTLGSDKRVASMTITGTDDRLQLPYAMTLGTVNAIAGIVPWELSQSSIPGALGRAEVSRSLAQ